eukprot:m51a1_g11069 hypothetical protein (194) ;mRNA; r:547870-548647
MDTAVSSTSGASDASPIIGYAVAIASGVVAAAASILATVVIEHWGGTVGGVVGTLPSTIVPASLGVCFTAYGGLVDSMYAVPLGMLLNAVVLLLWRELPTPLASALAFVLPSSRRGADVDSEHQPLGESAQPRVGVKVLLAATTAVTLAFWLAAATGLVYVAAGLASLRVPSRIPGLVAVAVQVVFGAAAGKL